MPENRRLQPQEGIKAMADEVVSMKSKAEVMRGFGHVRRRKIVIQRK